MFTVRYLAAIYWFFLISKRLIPKPEFPMEHFYWWKSVDLFPAGAGKDAPYYPQGEVFEDFLNVGDHWNSSGRSVSISKSFFRTLPWV